VPGRLNALPDTHAAQALVAWLGDPAQAGECSARSALMTVVSEGSLVGSEVVAWGTRA
jgi:hypothetical protein